MAFNGSGVFSRLYNWVSDAANSIKITASRMDAEMDGFATGLSGCVTKDGQTTTTASIPFAAGLSVGANIDLDSNTFSNPPAGMEHIVTPCVFTASFSTSTGSVTGDGTVVTVGYDTEGCDYGSNFDTGTGKFTAPADGVYFFTATVYFNVITSGHNNVLIQFVNSGAPDPVAATGHAYNMADSSGALQFTSSTAMVLTSGETVEVQASVSGSTKTVDILGDNTSPNYTRFEGFRVY